MARWIEKLQNYEFQIEHRKGQLHNNADALSRRPCQLYCKHCSLAEKKQGIEVCQPRRLLHIKQNLFIIISWWKETYTK